MGNPDTTLVEADRWIIAEPGTFQDLARYPDLLVAFDADPELYEASNGYIVSEQGKPPDFVLEVASPSTASTDTGSKLDDYATLGVLEYWLLDRTGEHHGTRLAGYRLGDDGRYHAIAMDVNTAERGAWIQRGVGAESPVGAWAVVLLRPGYGPAHRRTG